MNRLRRLLGFPRADRMFAAALALTPLPDGAVLLLAEGDNLFAPPTSTAVAPVIPSPSPLDGLELTGVSRFSGELLVSLTDRSSQRTHWLTIGHPVETLVALEYDAGRDAVLVQSGTANRWITMRRASIRDFPVARLADGSIDWFHMNLTEKQKEEEAVAMMGDILEAGHLARQRNAKTRPVRRATPRSGGSKRPST